MESVAEKSSNFASDGTGEKISENGFGPDTEKHVEGTVKTVHLKRKLQSRHLQMIGKDTHIILSDHLILI